MKRILALLIAMAITAALWAGGTAVYASIYTISAPNLTVTFDDGVTSDAVTRNVGITYWEPGFAAFRNIKIECDSKVNWKLKFDNASTSSQSVDANLSDVIDVYWSYTENIVGKTRSAALGNMTYVGTLTQFLDKNAVISDDQHPISGSTSITVVLKMRESAGNEYQGLSENFTVTVQVDAVNTSASNPTETTN